MYLLHRAVQTVQHVGVLRKSRESLHAGELLITVACYYTTPWPPHAGMPPCCHHAPCPSSIPSFSSAQACFHIHALARAVDGSQENALGAAIWLLAIQMRPGWKLSANSAKPLIPSRGARLTINHTSPPHSRRCSICLHAHIRTCSHRPNCLCPFPHHPRAYSFLSSHSPRPLPPVERSGRSDS